MSKDKNQQIYTQAWAWVIKKVSVVVRWYTITVKKDMWVFLYSYATKLSSLILHCKPQVHGSKIRFST